MKNQDQLMVAILAGIVILIVVAFVLALRSPEPSYRAEDTPEGVAHNYLMAIREKDYDRAFAYLSPTLDSGPESVSDFTLDARDSWEFRRDEDVSMTVLSADVNEDAATVKVREIRHYQGGLFESGQTTSLFTMYLRQEDGEWKVEDSDVYFSRHWKED